MVLRNVAKQFSFEQQRQEINEIAVDLDAINTTLTNYNVSNWNTAYSWGNHANAGYWVQNNTKISEWDTAYSWGNHASAGYWVQNNTKISEWDTAYSWGNHANAGYWVQNNTKISNWDTAYSWGNHANAGYLTSTGSIDTHNDVTISSVAGNQLLRYNSTTSQWENWTPNYLTISNDNVYFGDNDIAYFGDGNDLALYHDGSVSYINDQGTGGLYIQTNGDQLALRSYASSDYFLKAVPDGSVTLYYDNSKKFETTSIGAKVTGELVVNGPSNPADYSLTDGIFVQPANGLSGLTITTGSATNNAYINFSAGTASNAEQFAFAIGRDGLNSQGMVKINDVDVARFGSTGIIMPSGKGIDFSAAGNAAGMTSELLNDYEEGTWTPALVASGYTFTFGSQTGRYTKVGNCVYFKFYLIVSYSSGSGTVSANISGLPFTTSTSTANYGACSVYPDVGAAFFPNVLGLRTNPNSTVLSIACGFNSSGITSNFNWANITANTEFEVSGFYFTP